MILKQFRFTIECTLDVEDLTTEMVHRIKKPLLYYEESIQDPETWERAERQQRLLHVLLQDSTALERYIRLMLSWRIGDLMYDHLESRLEVEEEREENILFPLLKRMSPEDAKRLEIDEEDDDGDGMTDLLIDCFILNLDRLTLIEETSDAATVLADAN